MMPAWPQPETRTSPFSVSSTRDMSSGTLSSICLPSGNRIVRFKQMVLSDALVLVSSLL